MLGYICFTRNSALSLYIYIYRYLSLALSPYISFHNPVLRQLRFPHTTAIPPPPRAYFCRTRNILQPFSCCTRTNSPKKRIFSQALIPKPLLRREAPPSPLTREIRVAEFLACVHFALVPFRASALEKAAGPRDASIACAKV